MLKNNFFIRLTNWEFWPTGLVYFPVIIYYLWLALKSRSFFFFTVVNSEMETGGLFGTSKYKQLCFLPEHLKPITVLISKDESINNVIEHLKDEKISFPCIAKPDKAERGVGVELLHNGKDLENYLHQATSDFLIQEYITYPFEAGVFYYRFPGNISGEIPSIVLKEFLNVVGDGKSSIKELIHNSFRAKLTWEKQQIKLGVKAGLVPGNGEKVLLEPIGNHNRGTAFFNGNHLINEGLENIFSKISDHLPGFYYGRFDFKAPSLEAFCKGENIKILEVNGVNAEPAHIYDPSGSLWTAWKTLIHHWDIIYKISKKNKNKGIKPLGFSEALLHFKEWKKQKS
ncbi:MAG: hypothetical protein H0V01_12685 [Bacteroidetes bacterium]|nr:hypothetical protein [Bacteroidota bacterium]HET6244119.1 hypothetical protein [Bacteroidia bacterium]